MTISIIVLWVLCSLLPGSIFLHLTILTACFAAKQKYDNKVKKKMVYLCPSRRKNSFKLVPSSAPQENKQMMWKTSQWKGKEMLEPSNPNWKPNQKPIQSDGMKCASEGENRWLEGNQTKIPRGYKEELGNYQAYRNMGSYRKQESWRLLTAHKNNTAQISSI